jgi:hypothetical protein
MKEKPVLSKLDGCRDCFRLCRFNAPIARADIAEQSATMRFNCNSVNFLTKEIIEVIKEKITERLVNAE